MQQDRLGQLGPARNKKWINPEFGRQQWAAEDKNLFHSDRETAAGRPEYPALARPAVFHKIGSRHIDRISRPIRLWRQHKLSLAAAVAALIIFIAKLSPNISYYGKSPIFLGLRPGDQTCC